VLNPNPSMRGWAGAPPGRGIWASSRPRRRVTACRPCTSRRPPAHAGASCSPTPRSALTWTTWSEASSPMADGRSPGSRRAKPRRSNGGESSLSRPCARSPPMAASPLHP